MSFIRPEVQATLRRWREVLAGAAAVLAAAYVATAGTTAAAIIAAGLAIAGALLIYAGIQRARFRKGSGGRGVVQVTERQVAYYGPEVGGILAVEDLTSLDLEKGAHGAAWTLWHAGGPPLTIPTTAPGAEGLFDVFSTLPGLRPASLLTALETAPNGVTRIWARPSAVLH